MTAAAPRILILNPRDNVAVATSVLEPGAEVPAGDLTLRVGDRIAFGHKLAIRAIGAGDDVIKYGEVIGRATSDIEPGAHVHVHNVVSARLPGG
jgi:altronate dehydratase